MDGLDQDISEYQCQLKKGQIQKAYKGIMKYMTSLRSALQMNHPDYLTSSLYFGYMDMSYFSFTPSSLKDRKLKIAIVYLHEENRFEVWLSAVNRSVQKKTADFLRRRDTSDYKVSVISKGVDSVIEKIIMENPSFEDSDKLGNEIEKKVLSFISDMEKMTQEIR
ncbi:DUF7000 family protein [Proteiniclasticum sp.]|uniref:DUF7000 family protein n=1 Tax=Proteiniclasticum sp. TaxID=2053595 RepID=UPI0028963FF9|nr:hypothetical protein [Proteiniclasticum sp.]